MNVRLAIFDMVGTTIQAGDEVPSSFRDALLGVGVELSDSAIARVRGRSKMEAIADLLSGNPVTSQGGPDLDTASDLDAAAAARVGWSIGVLSGAHSRTLLEAHPHSAILESVAGLPDWLLQSRAVQPEPPRHHGVSEQ